MNDDEDDGDNDDADKDDGSDADGIHVILLRALGGICPTQSS